MDFHLYPVHLNLKGKTCVVVGGGRVATRKVYSLRNTGCNIRLIGSCVSGELQKLAECNEVEWIKRSYLPGDLSGATVVFAATSDKQTQQDIHREAQKRGVLLNSADDPVCSDLHVPAHFRRGKLLVSVATGGGSPALSRLLRSRLEKDIDPGYGLVAELLADIRSEIVTSERDSGDNKIIFSNLINRGIVDIVRTSNWSALAELLEQELPQWVDNFCLLRDFFQRNNIDSQLLEK